MISTPIGSHKLVRWQIINVALLVTGYSGYYLCRSNLSVTMPLLISELAQRGLSAGRAQVMLGTVASLGVLAYAIGKFPSGSLADVFGGRRNFLVGMGGSIAFTLLFAASGSLPLFTLAWMGNRLVQSLGWAGAVKITSRWFAFQRYGTVMALISLSFLFGDAAARQFMAVLISKGMGWRGVFMTTAIVLFLLLVICALLLRESPAQIGEPEPSVNPSNLFSQATVTDRPRGLRQLLQPFFGSSVFWLACALSLGTTILRETFNLWTPTYFTQVISMSAGEAAGASALFPLLGGISVILCGWLSDRLGRGGRASLMLGGLFLSCLVLIVLGLGMIHDSRTWTVILVAAVAFLILGPYSFLAGAIALDFGGKHGSGTASGLIDGAGYLGGVLAGDSMARISVNYGWNKAFFTLALIALLSGMAAAWFLREERRIGPRTEYQSTTA
jgi:OPA family glycerol-3-phosphate transporter-like MFS transporter